MPPPLIPSPAQVQGQPRVLSPLERVGFNDRFWRSVDLTRAQFGAWS